MAETTLEVTGMACDGCEQNVIDAFEGIEGVESVTPDHEADEVRVEHDGVDEETIGTTIEDAGYEVVG